MIALGLEVRGPVHGGRHLPRAGGDVAMTGQSKMNDNSKGSDRYAIRDGRRCLLRGRKDNVPDDIFEE
eukprot:8476747-Pyramimonas_sp.AAC.1